MQVFSVRIQKEDLNWTKFARLVVWLLLYIYVLELRENSCCIGISSEEALCKLPLSRSGRWCLPVLCVCIIIQKPIYAAAHPYACLYTPTYGTLSTT